MKKYKLEVGFIIVCVALIVTLFTMGATKPPVPIDIPFEYDPNLCLSPVMDWKIAEPNMSAIYAVGAHNKWGLDIDVGVTCPDPNVYILVDRLEKKKDPAGGWNQFFQFAMTFPPEEKVHYLEVIAVDKAGRQDIRTLLVYTVYDDAPFIFISEPVSMTRIKEAQKLWQVAMKKGVPLTKPTRLLN